MARSQMPNPANLTTFDRLGSCAHLYEPFSKKPNHANLTTSPQHPDTIILCTWPGAKQYQIGHYTAGYARLFPTSRILVITSPDHPTPAPTIDSDSDSDNDDDDEVDLFYTPPATPTHNEPPPPPPTLTTSPLHEAALALLPSSYPLPVSRTLAFHPTPRRTMISTARRGVLLHLFSTPGALQACALARAYRSAFAGRALDVQAVVFDSIPLHARRDTSMLFRDGVTAGLITVLGDVWTWMRTAVEYAGTGTNNPSDERVAANRNAAAAAQQLARDLADRSLLRQAPRHCYVFPERHAMELWRASGESGAVERTEWFVLRDQVDVAREDGIKNVDERRYWAAIQELWVD